ncbi:WecB/TagA/CpsF family glycosyltransferase [Algoriphagus sp. NG3]|uniref:WecB/TagA/CpsF family glycosyltransferase n=1 Tax=Algoriphagus sp. NG3 TaxID=3097546 RepID=UPI002A81618F|nr:WecB/TagA/CpsF family glycosyltransferase [Algoriphagus sp. NG3]WPR77512.1 WecB/TagA/CpsF family glycosyltransferase [Algoriphagus sp. NG3]
MNKIPKINIASVGISNCDLDDTVAIFSDVIRSNDKIRVCVTPVNCVEWAQDNLELRDIYNSADLTLCDGVPLIWISKFLGNPLKGRVTGLDVLPQFAEVCQKEGFTMFLLGAKEGVGEELKKHFEKQHPGIKIVGVYSPPFAERFSDEENEKMINMVNAVQPDILWVSLTAPKQDYWIYEHFDRLNTNIAIGVGGAFEVTAGLIKRSPRWMQKIGLEWLFRFLSEPKRLFRRYFIEAPQIFPAVWKQKLGKS